MSYTIATLDEIHGTQSLSIEKYGNQYSVNLSDRETHMHRHKTYNTLDEAIAVFQTISAHIIRGDYSYADRAAML